VIKVPLRPWQIKHATAPEDRIPKAGIASATLVALPESLTYGISQLANPVLNVMLGVNPILIGVMQGITTTINGCADPILGHLSDNTRSRWGRRKPFIVVGVLACAVLFPLIWFLPEGASDQRYLWQYGIMATLFSLAFTTMVVPLQALLFEATGDYHERTRLFAWRGLATQVAGGLTHWVFWFMQLGIFGSVFVGMRVYGLFVGALFLLLGLLPVFFLQERLYHAAAKQDRMGFLKAARITITNRAYVLLICTGILVGVASQIINYLGFYMKIYVVFQGDTTKGAVLAGTAGTAYVVTAILCTPLVAYVARRLGKRKALVGALMVALLGNSIKWFAYTPDLFWSVPLVAVLIAPSGAALGVLMGSMGADICDDDELKTGTRREGMYATIGSLLSRTIVSMSGLVAGVVLVLIGFDAKLGPAQDPHAMWLLRVVFISIPICCNLLAILCVLKYPLTEERMYDIRAELKIRRAERESGSTPVGAS